MKFKFFPRAAATVSLLGAFWLVATVLVAQVPSPAAPGSPAASKVKTAHVRFLNLFPLDGGTLEFFAGASTAGQPLQVAPPSNFYATYFSLPPVRTTFQVFRIGNLQAPLKSVDTPLRADAFFTVLVRLQSDGQPTVELIDETPDPKIPPTNRLTVRQFYRGAKVSVTAAERIKSNALEFGESQMLTNLPEGIVPLTMAAVLVPGGPPRTLNVDANFQRYRRATIYIVTDPYDRLRPRVVVEGPSRTEEDALRAAATPVP